MSTRQQELMHWLRFMAANTIFGSIYVKYFNENMPFGSTLVISCSRTSVCSKGRTSGCRSGCGSKIGESFAFDEGLNRAGASFRCPSGGWDEQSLSIRHRMKGYVPIKVKHDKEKKKLKQIRCNGYNAWRCVRAYTRPKQKQLEKNRIRDKWLENSHPTRSIARE